MVSFNRNIFANKKLIKFMMFIVCSVVIIFSIMFMYYLFTTYSPQGCKDYCAEHSERNATQFTRIGDGRYIKDYAYFIAADGDSDKPQEIFIFKRKFFGLITLDRYEFIVSSVQLSYSDDTKTKFGSIQFFTENDKGEKESSSTLIFFGATKDSSIKKYDYTLTVREGSNVYSGNVVDTGGIWFIKFFNINEADEYSKKIVSDVNFYNINGDLIDSY